MNTQAWPFQLVLIFIQKMPAFSEPKHMGNQYSQNTFPFMKIFQLSHNCVCFFRDIKDMPQGLESGCVFIS